MRPKENKSREGMRQEHKGNLEKKRLMDEMKTKEMIKEKVMNVEKEENNA